MSFEITTYNCNRIRATANGRCDFWSVDIEFSALIERKVHRSMMIVHFTGDKAEQKANAYAKAINLVDDQFYSIRTVLERSVARQAEQACEGH